MTLRLCPFPARVLQWGCGQDAAICLVTVLSPAGAEFTRMVNGAGALHRCFQLSLSCYFPWLLQVHALSSPNRFPSGAPEAGGLALCLPCGLVRNSVTQALSWHHPNMNPRHGFGVFACLFGVSLDLRGGSRAGIIILLHPCLLPPWSSGSPRSHPVFSLRCLPISSPLCPTPHSFPLCGHPGQDPAAALWAWVP